MICNPDSISEKPRALKMQIPRPSKSNESCLGQFWFIKCCSRDSDMWLARIKDHWLGKPHQLLWIQKSRPESGRVVCSTSLKICFKYLPIRSLKQASLLPNNCDTQKSLWESCPLNNWKQWCQVGRFDDRSSVGPAAGILKNFVIESRLGSLFPNSDISFLRENTFGVDLG